MQLRGKGVPINSWKEVVKSMNEEQDAEVTERLTNDDELLQDQCATACDEPSVQTGVIDHSVSLPLSSIPCFSNSYPCQGAAGYDAMSAVEYDCGLPGASKAKQGCGPGIALRTVETPLKNPQSRYKSRNYAPASITEDDTSDEEIRLLEAEISLRRLRLKRRNAAERKELRVSDPVSLHEVNHSQNASKSSFSGNLEQVLSQLVHGVSMPKIEIEAFDGSPLKFHSFLRSFKLNVADRLSDNGQRLSYLIYYCKDPAKRAIQHCVMLPPDEGYAQAMQILQERFGRPHEIIQAVTRGLLEGPKLVNADLDGLRDLAMLMRNSLLTVGQLGRPSDLNCSLYLMRIVGRLPRSMQERWADAADAIINKGMEPTFDDLLKFIEKRISVASNMYGQMLLTTPRQEAVDPRFAHRQARFAALVGDNSPASCPLCSEMHSLDQCQEFLRRSLNERLSVLKNNKRCFLCLRPNHMVKSCKSRAYCGNQGCKRRHHKLLHGDLPPKPATVSSCGTSAPRRSVLLGFVPLRLVGPLGTVETYGFLDNGSDSTLVDRELAHKIGLVEQACTLNVETIHGARRMRCGMTQLGVQTLSGERTINVDRAYTTDRLPFGEANDLSKLDLSAWPHLIGLDLPSIARKSIGILLGCDVPEAHEVLDQRVGYGKQPYAVKTHFGWTLRGPCSSEPTKVRCVNSLGTEEESLSSTLSRFFELEFRDEDPNQRAHSVEDRLALSKVESSTELVHGRYVVGVPWKDDRSLENNYKIARHRLELLRKRLIRDPVLKERYAAVIRDHEAKGYVSQTKVDGSERWYLPHHPVYNMHKPDKVRIVFDCAASYKGKSLNSVLLSGPDLNNSLVGVLLRFRKFRVAVCADIKEMFLQVKMPDIERPWFSFLWWPDPNLLGDPKVYQMNVHPFGATSSPFCASYALRRTVVDFAVSETCKQVVLENFYVDDCLVSVDSVSEAKRLADELRSTLAKGGFNLTKWSSSEPSALSDIPETEYASTDEQGIFNSSMQSTLGLIWDVTTDAFQVSVKSPSRPVTKRGILSCVASIYDPLGFVAPMTLPARCLLQELCKASFGWDVALPAVHVTRWLQWLSNINSAGTIRVPRYLGLSKTNSGIQLHMFSDASDTGYGAAGYLRVVTDGSVVCRLVLGKSRVAPRKITTLPRMELIAAALSAKLLKQIVTELKLPLSERFLWTDSMVVLHYLNNTSSRFPTFVANRVRLIHELTGDCQWRHVPSELNPADVASRGAKDAHSSDMQLWLNGPEFLRNASSEWPKSPLSMVPNPADLEVKLVAITATPVCWHREWFARYSSWMALLRSVAWITRFRGYIVALNGKKSYASLNVGPITMKEIRASARVVVRLVQEECFGSRGDRSIARDLKGLNPVLVDNVWCVGGRLQASDHNTTLRPVILPAKHAVTDLVINYEHQMNGHVGAVQVLGSLRRSFWIVRGMAQVRRVLGKCPKCKLLYQGPENQIMAPLPPERVCSGGRPFRFCGVDYFGPFLAKQGRSLHKRYGCLFTCLQTRAVHIEVAHSLSTDSFIMALMRFTNRRGMPEVVYSDNGSNFVGAEKELMRSLNTSDQNELSRRLLAKGIEWKFNPPGASHRGGVWERIIRSIRKILAAVLDLQSMSDEVFATSMTEIERILNDRPLVPVYDDPSSPTVLRPSDLLLLQTDHCTLNTTVSLVDRYTKGWKQAQHMANVFWRRWTREYLPTLQMRHKWTSVHRDIKQGDLVLLVDYSAPRNNWKKGIVINVFPSQDGHNRCVEVRTANDSSLRRDIRSLCLLEGDITESSVSAS